MRRAAALRLLAVAALLAALFGLAAWHGTLAPAPDLGSYPGADELGADYGRYVGERVAVGGIVVGTDPIVIETEDGAGRPLRLTVRGTAARPAAGDWLRVYGIVEEGRTIRAVNAFAVPAAGRWYTWSVSFLAGLWTLARIARYWRVDRRTLGLRRRDDA